MSETTKSLMIKAECEQSEMGLRLRFFSKACIIQVELDLDADPEYFHAMAHKLPELVGLQMEQWAKDHPDE